MTSNNSNLTSTFDVDRLKDKYLALNSTQDSIQTLSLWVLHHKAHCEKIIEVWLKIFKKSKSRQKLNLFYLANDVIQNSKKRNARIFISVFKRALIEAVYNIKNDNIKPQVSRILNILSDRKFYDKVFINKLLVAIGEDIVDNSLSSAKVPSNKNLPKKVGLNKPDFKGGDGAEIYKPNDLFLEINKMDKLTNDTRNKEFEVEKCLSHFDLNSKEWVKNYKDKVSGQRLDTNLENCSLKLESFIPFMEMLIKDRNTLTKNVERAIDHYATIYEDAKFVTMAYKKYASRVRGVQQKVKSNKDQVLPKLPKQSDIVEEISQKDRPQPQTDIAVAGVGQGGIDAFEAQKLFQNLSKLVGSFGKEGLTTPQKSDTASSKDTDLRKSFEETNRDVDLRYPSPPQRDSAQITDMELGYDEEDTTGSTALDNRIDSLFVKQDVDARTTTNTDEKFVESSGQSLSPDTSTSPLFLLPPPPPPPLLPLSTTNDIPPFKFDTSTLVQQHSLEQPQPDPTSAKPLDILTRLIGLNKGSSSVQPLIARPMDSEQPLQTYQTNTSYTTESDSYHHRVSSNPSNYYPTAPVVYRASSLRTQYQSGDDEYPMSPPPFDYGDSHSYPDINNDSNNNDQAYPNDIYRNRQNYGHMPLETGASYTPHPSPYMKGSYVGNDNRNISSLGMSQEYQTTSYPNQQQPLRSYASNYANSVSGGEGDRGGNPNLLIIGGNNAQARARNFDYNQNY